MVAFFASLLIYFHYMKKSGQDILQIFSFTEKRNSHERVNDTILNFWLNIKYREIKINWVHC